MNRYLRLLNYLDHVISNRRGWVPEYKDSVCNGDRNYLLGHYEGLVGDIIDIIGAKRLQRLVIILTDIEDMKKE